MVTKQTVFALTVLIFVFAVLLTIAVIAVAIFFQKLRKQIEAEIKAERPRDNEIMSKVTVSPRKKENKYSTKKRRSGDLEPQFYEAPPLRDEQREILQMRAFQKQEENEDQDQVTHLAASGKESTMLRTLKKEDSYIECIGYNDVDNSSDEVQRMTTFQNPSVSSQREPLPQLPQKYKSYATTLPRPLERDNIDGECMRRIKPSHGATLPAHAHSPIKKGGGHGLKVGFYDTNFTSTNGNDGGEMYEAMEDNSEIYENTGYVDDSSEDFYGNQEIIEKENKRRSQTNMVPLPQHSRNWNSKNAKYNEENYEEEVYENQEIVEQQRRRSALRDANNHFELYENYVAEEMYENC